MKQIRLLPYEVRSATWNMFLDEVLLERVEENQSPPTLRFYGWERPTLSLGRSQLESMLPSLEIRESFELVQRPTGGAIAVHGKDLSYALVAPMGEKYLPQRPKNCYKAVHESIASALAKFGCPVECVPDRRSVEYREKIYCGLSLSAYDIVHTGRKIVGSAQRHKRGNLLQHGFILLDENFDWVVRFLGRVGERTRDACISVADIVPQGQVPAPETLSAAIAEALADLLDVRFEEGELTRDECRDVETAVKDHKLQSIPSAGEV